MTDWDEKYAGEAFAYGTAPNDFLMAHVGLIPAGRVLALADGEGRNGVFLAQRGFAVETLDSSAVGVAKARRLAAQVGVSVDAQVTDLGAFTFPEAVFSGVVSIFCHLPPELRARVHRQAVQSLQPGGLFLLEAFTPEQLNYGTGGPPKLELLMSLSALREELADLEEIHGVEVERQVVEGQLHTGLAHVVQFIGRKR